MAKRAAEHNVPAILVSGALKGDTAALEKLFAGCFSISPGAVTLAEALAGTRRNLMRTGASIARIIHLTGY